MPTDPDERSLEPQPPELTLLQQSEWLGVILSSIGNAVITTDANGRVALLNAVAHSLTGWTQAEAVGARWEAVFRVINEESRREIKNPILWAKRDRGVVAAGETIQLISRDGTERSIDHCVTPIRNAQGTVAGVVLVFRDVTERRGQERELRDALAYAAEVIETPMKEDGSRSGLGRGGMR